MLGLLAPLSPAVAAGESLELPTGKHPPWKTFISLHPRRGAGRMDSLMSAERLKRGTWTPSKIFARQQRVSRVVGSLHGCGQEGSSSRTAPAVNPAASRCAAGRAKRATRLPVQVLGASQPGRQERRFLPCNKRSAPYSPRFIFKKTKQPPSFILELGLEHPELLLAESGPS